MTFPTPRQSTTSTQASLTAAVNTYALSSAAVAGNLLIICLAGDKNTGSVSVTDNIGTNSGANPWTIETSIPGASVSLYIARKVAVGGETTITATTSAASTTGNTGYCEELADDGAGAWMVVAKVTPAYSDTARASAASGTTDTADYDGRALAVAVVDSQNTMTATPTFSGYTTVNTPVSPAGSGGGNAACYVGTADVAAGATTSTTFASNGGSDQMTCAIVVVGRVEAAGATPTVADTVGIVDAAARAVTLARTVNDSIGLLDAAAGASTAAQVLTDSLGLADSATQASASDRVVSDSVGASDTVAATQGWAATLADAVGLTDTAQQVSATAQILTDSVGLLDTAASTSTAARSLADPVGVTDTPSRTSAAAQSLTDPVGLTDGAATDGGVAATVADSVGVADSVAAVQGAVRAAGDAVGLTDSQSVTATIARTILDGIGLDDAIATTTQTADPWDFVRQDLATEARLTDRRSAAVSLTQLSAAGGAVALAAQAGPVLCAAAATIDHPYGATVDVETLDAVAVAESLSCTAAVAGRS